MTEMVALAVISPLARTRTPSSLRRTRPDATSESSVMDGCVQLAGVDEFLDQAQVHNCVCLAVRLVEAALGQTLVQRHLAAFVAIDGHARTGFLTFDTTAAHFTGAGARAAGHTRLRFLVAPVDCRCSS